MSSRLGSATQGSRCLPLPVDAGRFSFFSICFLWGVIFFFAVLNYFQLERVTYQTVCLVPRGGTRSVTQRVSQTRLQPKSPRRLCSTLWCIRERREKEGRKKNNNKHLTCSFLKRVTASVLRRYGATTSVRYCRVELEVFERVNEVSGRAKNPQLPGLFHTSTLKRARSKSLATGKPLKWDS